MLPIYIYVCVCVCVFLVFENFPRKAERDCGVCVGLFGGSYDLRLLKGMTRGSTWGQVPRGR